MSDRTLRDLHHDLRSCQQRLGTATEEPGDFDLVLRLAHEINNRLTVESIQLGLEAVSEPTAPAARRLDLATLD